MRLMTTLQFSSDQEVAIREQMAAYEMQRDDFLQQAEHFRARAARLELEAAGANVAADTLRALLQSDARRQQLPFPAQKGAVTT